MFVKMPTAEFHLDKQSHTVVSQFGTVVCSYLFDSQWHLNTSIENIFVGVIMNK